MNYLGLGYIGLGLGMGICLVGAGLGIGRLASAALEMGVRPGPVSELLGAVQSRLGALIRGSAAAAVKPGAPKVTDDAIRGARLSLPI